MALIKPPFDGTGMVSGFYDGPPPTPGIYKGEVTRMGLGKIQSGENAGADKLVIVVRITHGKFKGAELFHQLLLLKQNAWTVNQFLHSMTDGSEKQKNGIEKFFWQLGYDVEETAKNEKLGQQFNWIGKPSFVPIGKPTAFAVVKDGDRAVVDKFVTGLEVEDETDTPENDVAEVLAEVVSETPTPAPTPEPEPVAAPEPTAAVAAVADDDDDPWG